MTGEMTGEVTGEVTVEGRDVLVLLPTREQLRLVVRVSARRARGRGDRG